MCTHLHCGVEQVGEKWAGHPSVGDGDDGAWDDSGV